MTRRIYVASSWRNAHQPAVVDALRADGHQVYDFRHPRSGGYPHESASIRGFHWSEIDPDWQRWTPARYVEALRHPIAGQGFASDWNAMCWADTAVLVLPSGRSAHIEAGYFAGAGKELFVLMLEPQEPELMYLMARRICLSVEDLVRMLSAVRA